MRRGLDVAAVLVVIGVVLYLFYDHKNPGPPYAAQSNQPSSAVRSGDSPGASNLSPTTLGNGSRPSSSTSQTQPSSLAEKAGQFVPDSIPDAPLRPETALQNVRRVIRKYSEMFGGNPVGTNPEIASQLSGDNPKQINFITAEAGMRLNGEGELVDTWGTPYFFHQISGSEMEIHSAGPDKVMWTADDLIVK